MFDEDILSNQWTADNRMHNHAYRTRRISFHVCEFAFLAFSHMRHTMFRCSYHRVESHLAKVFHNKCIRKLNSLFIRNFISCSPTNQSALENGYLELICNLQTSPNEFYAPGNPVSLLSITNQNKLHYRLLINVRVGDVWCTKRSRGYTKESHNVIVF